MEQQTVTLTGNTTLTTISVGHHNITVYANDAFGNSVASKTISFTVAKPASHLSEVITVVVLGVAIAAAVCTCFVINCKRRKRSSV